MGLPGTAIPGGTIPGGTIPGGTIPGGTIPGKGILLGGRIDRPTIEPTPGSPGRYQEGGGRGLGRRGGNIGGTLNQPDHPSNPYRARDVGILSQWGYLSRQSAPDSAAPKAQTIWRTIPCNRANS